MSTERELQNIRYWTDFCDYLRQRGSQLESRTSKSRHFIDFRIGTGCFLRARQVIGGQNGHAITVGVGFILKGNARNYFDELKEKQAEIKKEFGEELQWLADRDTEKRIDLRRYDLDPTDESDWPHQHEWMATKLEKLNEVLGPWVEALRDW